ncbi:hypothetical protein JOD67_000878 [Tenggerimyces flavus]|nr:hypothetical protein [Tenggerimyces flavus]
MHRRLPGSAYVDLDQLGICYPEPADDPGRHRLQLENLRAVAENFRGASALVVSGVVDPRGRVAPDVGLLCRLHASPDDVRTRLLGRGDGDLPGALAELEALERRGIGLRVDTTGLTVAEVADRVAERTGWLTHPLGGLADPPVPSAEANDVAVHLICGPTGVGKSTVGWRVYERLLATGATAGYVDLEQLGFCPPNDHRAKAANLAVLATAYRKIGATALVVVGPVDEPALQAYAQALGTTRLRVHALYTDRDELTRRILSRHDQPSWAAPGDRLNRQPLEVLRRIAAETRPNDLGHRVDTTAKTVDEVADEIVG